MSGMAQIKRQYNAIVTRGTITVPTFDEVARDTRRADFDRTDIQSRF